MFADLHLHTHFSDGTYSPEELAHHAQHQRLSVIALTDHDTLEGCERAAAACHELGLGFIPAAEFTTEVGSQEMHLLGYYLDAENGLLREALARFQQVRQDRVREMTQRLNRLGVHLEVERVFALAACRCPGRPHMGRALVEVGVCSSVDEAFDRFLKRGRPGWVPKLKMSAPEAIELIHGAGGLAVIAHPGLNRLDGQIPNLAAAGIDGIECYHSRHSPAVTDHYLRQARKHALLVTGGSDCHGMSKGKPTIGTVKLPMEYVEALADRVADRGQSRPPTTAGHPRCTPAA